jgi:hypothetical protein
VNQAPVCTVDDKARRAVIGWIEISLDAVALVLVIWAIWSLATNPNPFPF